MASVLGKGLTTRSIHVVAILMLCMAAAAAQTNSTKCRPEVIPVETEPPPKLFVDAPLAAPLARGVAVIQYCSENLHIVPVFGAKALAVTPRVGHLHVRVDDASWVWAEASGNPIILMGLSPGPHKVTVELVNANHQPLDKAEVTFNIPRTVSGQGLPEKRAASDKSAKNTSGKNTERDGDLDAVHHQQ